LWLIMISFVRSFELYLCFGNVQKFQFLVKGKAPSTGKLLDSLPRNNAGLCSGEFHVAYCNDLEWKLPTPPITCWNLTVALKLLKL
jgi:hypothetical protein